MKCWLPKLGPGLLTAFLCLAVGLGHSGESLATPLPATHAFSGTLNTQFAFADFDGDHKPDLAVLHAERFSSLKTRYSIVFALSTGNQQTMELVGPSGGLEILSRDVNGDNTPDLVVQAVRRHQPVAIFLNDGYGNFTFADPARYPMELQQSDAELSRATPPGEHGAFLIGTKFVPGESAESGASFPPGRTAGLLFLATLRADDRLFLSSSSGRAPPVVSKVS
jgi:hypothetical protein